ncbi:hypothetical protein BCR35DRAFT_350318 [Leucosporidium creatinivorum]|uniref:Homeodomain-like protein n=1 Tax=Leucosporidium creatinivorum TaxID=106004 RepID=A0A1Y2FYX3_9BASI|nr:hypothetical protein BCR35DRAFT_350318 [Leucosporidium creatinivorum]
MEPGPNRGTDESATAPSAAQAEHVESSAASDTSLNVNKEAPRMELNGAGSQSQLPASAEGSTQLQNTSLDQLASTANSPQTRSDPSHDALLAPSEAARLAAQAAGLEAVVSPARLNAPSPSTPTLPSSSTMPGQEGREGEQQVSARVDSEVSYAGGSADAVESLLETGTSGGALAPSHGAVGARRLAPKPRAPKGKGRAVKMGASEDGQHEVVASTSSAAEGNVERRTAETVQEEEEEELDEQTRLRLLFALDQKADETLAANSRYAQEVVAVMHKLEAAQNRSEELQSIVKDLHTELADGTDTVIIAPGTMQVTLPWHKHFHGQDLPSTTDSAARELYLDTIRHTPWTSLERGKLKKEIIAQNNRHVAIEAHRLGQSISDRLAQTDPTFFEQSTEFLDWDKISQAIPRRSTADCRIQWLQQDHPSLKHGKWKKDELERLYSIVERKGERDWKGISEEMGTDAEGKRRTPAECLRQFRRRTGLKKEWTDEEDEKLRQGVRHFGEEWQSLALLVGRPSDQCINRWTKAVKPTIRRGQWQPEEDEAVRAAVASVGLNWLQIARRVEGRTDAQCRERWVNKLDPKITAAERWTEEENNELLRLRNEENKSWVEISIAFKGRRTDNQCMRRYNTLSGVNRRRRKADAEDDMPLDNDDDNADDAEDFVPPRSARPVKRKPARGKLARAEEDGEAPARRPRGRPKKVKLSGQVEQMEEQVEAPVEAEAAPEAEAQPMEVEVEEAQAEEVEEGAPRKSGRQRKERTFGDDFVGAW